MIVYRFCTNIVDEDACVIVNPVNCQGVSGDGVAFWVKVRFPNAQKHYENFCANVGMKPGQTLVSKDERNGKSITIIHVATKRSWIENSRLQWVDEGMRNVIKEIDAMEEKPRVVALPALGCGRGGLKPSDVIPIIKREISKRPDIEWRLYSQRG